MTADSHTHHWRIDTPVPGCSTVTGTCKTCGDSRQFPAWIPDEQLASFVVSNARYAKSKKQHKAY